MSEIILYDIIGMNDGVTAWSPNTWTVRFTLNYKNLKYKTRWLEFQDIEIAYKETNAKATSTRSDGSPYYTLPVLYDPATKTAIADALPIADYLDRTYPNPRKVFPEDTRALHAAFFTAMFSLLEMQMYRLIVLPGLVNAGPRAVDYYRWSKESLFGMTLEEITPTGGPLREGLWKEIESGWKQVAGWFDAASGGEIGERRKPFMGGEKPCYADFHIAARLICVKAIWGPQSEDWRRMSGLDGGRWANYLEQFHEYMHVDTQLR
ncbi:hypothetical protein EIP91_005183 [Steccherinum ochraceum]|uniref:GST N-terminal domain-containing protein n=1 Tax=Steccherinum ochraceum TaxID=92696 RepID=A0A4R0RMQ8_9APHY|nr:hypothetical protein EIP91_005183 [Steccherinum ochraceum]